MYETDVISVLGLFLLLSVSLLLVYLAGATQRTVIPATIAYLAQLSIGIALFLTVGLVADDIFYHDAAIEIADALRMGEKPPTLIGNTKASFIWILGSLYLLFGSNPLLGLAFNALLMGLIPSIMALSCREFGLERVARAAAWISALTPQFLFWAPWLRREALAFFLITLLILAMSLLFNSRFVAGFILFVLLLPALALTRAQLLAVAVAGGIAAVLLSHPDRRSMTSRAVALVTTLTLCVLPIFWLVPPAYFISILGPGTLDGVLREYTDAQQNLAAVGVSSEHNTSLLGFGLNLPRVIAGPFPWEWQNAAWIAAGLDGLYFLLCLATVIWVIIKCPAYRRQVYVLVIALIPLIVASTLVFGNYGIVMRVRAHFLPFLIPILAVAYDQMRKNRNMKQSLGLKSKGFRDR